MWWDDAENLQIWISKGIVSGLSLPKLALLGLLRIRLRNAMNEAQRTEQEQANQENDSSLLHKVVVWLKCEYIKIEIVRMVDQRNRALVLDHSVVIRFVRRVGKTLPRVLMPIYARWAIYEFRAQRNFLRVWGHWCTVLLLAPSSFSVPVTSKYTRVQNLGIHIVLFLHFYP